MASDRFSAFHDRIDVHGVVCTMGRINVYLRETELELGDVLGRTGNDFMYSGRR